MNTRSKSAAAAVVAARHPQAQEAFKEGLQSILRQWTALELAVTNQWGGPSSTDKANDLVEELLEMFYGPEKIFKDDVVLVLEDVMETEFNTVCEDDSPNELGELFCTMWRQCCDGDFSIVTSTLAREYVRNEQQTIAKCHGIGNTGDVMDSDEEADGDEVCATMEMIDELVAAQEEEIAESAEIPPENVMPLVDEEGFETVFRGRNKSNRKKN